MSTVVEDKTTLRVRLPFMLAADLQKQAIDERMKLPAFLERVMRLGLDVVRSKADTRSS